MLANAEQSAVQRSPRIASLRTRHQQLETQLSQTPVYNQTALAEIKRRKLRLKDEIAQLSGAAT